MKPDSTGRIKGGVCLCDCVLLLAKSGIQNLLQIGDFSHLKLIPMFKEVASCIPHQGNSVLPWKDNWQGPPMDIQFPELHSYVL